MTGGEVDGAGGNPIPLRRIEKRHVGGSTSQPPRSGKTGSGERLNPVQLGRSKSTAQRLDQSTRVTADVENHAGKGVAVSLYVVDQRGPKRFIDDRQVPIKRRIAKECLILDACLLYTSRCV